MHVMKFLRLVPFFFFLPGAAHAALEIQVEINSHTEAPPGAKNAPADRHTTMNASLGPGVMVVRSGATYAVYDFARRKRVLVDTANRQRVEFSLYDIVGFRAAELRNREMMAKALAAAKINAPAASKVDAENALSIQDGPPEPLQAHVDGADEVFEVGGQTVFRRSTDAMPVDKADARAFAQFMRYCVGGHPQVLARLTDTASVSRHYVLTTHTVGTTTEDIVVRSVKTIPAVNLPDVADVPLRKPSAPGLDTVDQVLDRAAALTLTDRAIAIERNQKELDAALRDGRGLDAYLRLAEAGLITGQAPRIAPEQIAMVQADANVKLLAPALAPRSKEEAAHAIGAIAQVRGATSMGYMLDIFEANDRARAGDGLAALKMMLRVLETHPAIASAYKDLGDFLYLRFDMPRAWRAWDVGRAMAPQIAIFRAVDQYEANLARMHPEFF
ncbi:MAG TPA: hypothetical protein VIE63_14700 [Ramlibacter sp.]